MFQVYGSISLNGKPKSINGNYRKISTLKSKLPIGFDLDGEIVVTSGTINLTFTTTQQLVNWLN